MGGVEICKSRACAYEVGEGTLYMCVFLDRNNNVKNVYVTKYKKAKISVMWGRALCVL